MSKANRFISFSSASAELRRERRRYNMDQEQSGGFSSPQYVNWVFKPDQAGGGFSLGPHKMPVRLNF